METVTVRSKSRVVLTGTKPGQVYALETNADGSILLIPVKAERKEPFPPGSLSRYVTKEDNEERLQLLKGCTLEVPE